MENTINLTVRNVVAPTLGKCIRRGDVAVVGNSFSTSVFGQLVGLLSESVFAIVNESGDETLSGVPFSVKGVREVAWIGLVVCSDALCSYGYDFIGAEMLCDRQWLMRDIGVADFLSENSVLHGRNNKDDTENI